MRPGIPNGFDAGEYNCDSSYANIGEAVLDGLRAVGIRARLRPIERVAFLKAYTEKTLKNIIQAGPGAFGNAATRLEAQVVTGGVFVYGTYPDIDALYREQAVEPIAPSGKRSSTRCSKSYMSGRSTRRSGSSPLSMPSVHALPSRASVALPVSRTPHPTKTFR